MCHGEHKTNLVYTFLQGTSTQGPVHLPEPQMHSHEERTPLSRGTLPKGPPTVETCLGDPGYSIRDVHQSSRFHAHLITTPEEIWGQLGINKTQFRKSQQSVCGWAPLSPHLLQGPCPVIHLSILPGLGTSTLGLPFAP